MNRVFIAIGSNIGDRYQNIYKVISNISLNRNISIISASNIYDSKAMYIENQDNFLNVVLELRTEFNPFDLLQLFKNIEVDNGRTKKQKHNFPRIIDIDILDYSNQIINHNQLILPHPKIRERIFVLKPWNDIAPNYYVKKFKKTINELMLLLDSNDKFIKLYNKKL